MLEAVAEDYLDRLAKRAENLPVGNTHTEQVALVAALQTGSMERGLETAERLNTGIVHVNDQTPNNDAYAPFGGTARPQAHGFPF